MSDAGPGGELARRAPGRAAGRAGSSAGAAACRPAGSPRRSPRPARRRASPCPAPPPAGVSSTVRCWSVADARMSRASSDQRPSASARPARLTPSGPGNISGKRVRTVARKVIVAGLRVVRPRPRRAARRRIDDDPPAGEVDLRHGGAGERDEQRLAARRRDLEEVAGAEILDRDDRAERRAVASSRRRGRSGRRGRTRPRPAGGSRSRGTESSMPFSASAALRSATPSKRDDQHVRRGRRPPAAARRSSKRGRPARCERAIGRRRQRIGGEGLHPHLALDAMRRADCGRRRRGRTGRRGHRVGQRSRLGGGRLGRRLCGLARLGGGAGAPAPSCRARPSRGLLRGVALGEAGGVEEAQHAVGRLGADAQPMLDALDVER